MFTYVLKNGIIITSGRIPKTGVPGGSSFVYPARINTHDHLRGNYPPRLGPQPLNFYVTWAPGDRALKTSAVFEAPWDAKTHKRNRFPGGKEVYV